MSADNGVYILKLKDQCRVIYTQCIDNLWWSFVEMESVGYFVPTRIVEYYQHANPMTLDEAREEAKKIADGILSDDFCSVLEYGISTFEINKTWEEIADEAKDIALQEIHAMLNTSDSDWDKNFMWYQEEIKKLEQILE
jgi:hypothetical protein